MTTPATRRHLAMLAALDAARAMVAAHPDADPGTYLTLFLHDRDDGSFVVDMSLDDAGCELARAVGCTPTGPMFASRGRAYRSLTGTWPGLRLAASEQVENGGAFGEQERA